MFLIKGIQQIKSYTIKNVLICHRSFIRNINTSQVKRHKIVVRKGVTK